MKPNQKLITIQNNEELIIDFFKDLITDPRINALKWAQITKQTPNLKIGYPGQHLASLVLGMEGTRTGARGDDIVDGSEVKSCSRIDQLDTCKDCGEKVLRIEPKCSNCNSENIKRMDDSKWLFGIRSIEELKLLTEKVPRIVLTLADYPNFKDNNFDDIRFQIYEIWNNSERTINFKNLMTNYYNNIFLEHKKLNANKTPAPKNFWPYSYQFYLCNPIKVFEAIIKNANINPKIEILHFVQPKEDRSKIPSQAMPINLLNRNEIDHLLQTLKSNNFNFKKWNFNDLDINKFIELFSFLPEEIKQFLPLRDSDNISIAKVAYSRR